MFTRFLSVIRYFIGKISLAVLAAILLVTDGTWTIGKASEFLELWRKKDRAIVIDAYEFNPIDWTKMLKDKRIGAFIAKASDGLPPKYGCTGNKTSYQFRYCRVAWRKYSVAKELYHTRKTLAKSAGLKWGAYHLGRAGNPEAQADHFIEFADPQPDEMMVIDVEDVNNKDFISLEDAEKFANRIHARLGRYPVLYANSNTIKFIALKRESLPTLSRLKLWYARYKGDIRGVFPVANWFRYLIWQFSHGGNCNSKRCPYRVPGTENNIDVNVMNMTLSELKKGWPFDGLIPPRIIDDTIDYQGPLAAYYEAQEKQIIEEDGRIIPDERLVCLAEKSQDKSAESCPVIGRNGTGSSG